MALREPWDALLTHAIDNTPFLTHEWLTAWWGAFGSQRSMYIVTVWHGEQLVAVAPLAYTNQRRFGAARTVITFMANEHSNRANFVVGDRPREALGAILDHLLTAAPRWDLMELEPLHEQSPVTQAFLEILASRSQLFGIEESLRSPYLNLPDTWTNLRSELGPTFRKALDRKLRKAGQSGSALRVVISADTSDLTKVFDISTESWQHAAGTGVGSEGARRFYRELAFKAAQRDWLRLAILEFDDLPISFQYNLLYNEVLYNLKLEYRHRFEALSPGLVLQAHVLQDLIRDGAREYDFLGTDDPYKLHWSRTLRVHHRLVVFTNRLDLRVAHFVLCRLKPYLKARFPLLVAIKRGLFP